MLRFSFDGEIPIDLHGGKDVNGDGRPDFAVATTVGVFVRSGIDGAQIHLLGAGESFASVALIDDLDGDGRPEVAARPPADRTTRARTATCSSVRATC